MKQGTGRTTDTAHKVEPKSAAINPGAVGGIGLQEVRTKHISIYEGRGLEAPMVGCTNHKSGSQGKH